MNIRRLKSFLAVADELNFHRAAERMNITQPALSQQIREFEDELGVKLFLRDKRTVAITEAGRVMLPSVQQAVDLLEAAADAARRSSLAAERTLRLGFSENIQLPFLSPALRWVSQHHPEISIEPRDLHSDAVIEKLLAQDIDVGFAFLPVEHGDLAYRPVLDGHCVLALPERHPLASMAAIPMSALADQRLILFARHLNPPLYDHINEALRAANGLDQNIVYHATQSHFGLNLVAEGVGLLFTTSTFAQEIPAGVTSRPLENIDEDYKYAAVWRGDRRTPAVRAFLDALDKSPVKTS
jgi:DNA-binding transcriptional LysR family regulator